MPAKKLKRFLDENHVRYVSIRHSPAYTAQETAASAHVPGRELAKTVMLFIDGEIPAGGGQGILRRGLAPGGWLP